MFGIGGFELFIILIFAFLIFGPEKLPEIGRTVGRAIAKFREAQQDMNEALDGEKLFDPNNPDEPFKDPMAALDKLAQHQEDKRKAKDGSGAAKAAGAKPGVSAEKTTATPAKGASDDSAEAAEKPRQESFTERKARYERERAARKAAEAQADASGGKGSDDSSSSSTEGGEE